MGESRVIERDTRRQRGSEAGAASRHVDIKNKQDGGREVRHPKQETPKETSGNATLRKDEGEMDQQRRRGKECGTFCPVDFPIERIELSGIVKREKYE